MNDLTFYLACTGVIILGLAVRLLFVLGVIFMVNFFFPETLAYDWRTVLAFWILLCLPKFFFGRS